MILPDRLLKLVPAEVRKTLGRAGMTASEAQGVAVAKSERELQGQLVNLLRLRGVAFVINQRFGSRTTAPVGTPDILFAISGVACAWEVKMPGQHPKPDQVCAMFDMERDGWRVAVIRSYDEGRAFLRGFDKGSEPVKPSVNNKTEHPKEKTASDEVNPA